MTPHQSHGLVCGPNNKPLASCHEQTAHRRSEHEPAWRPTRAQRAVEGSAKHERKHGERSDLVPRGRGGVAAGARRFENDKTAQTIVGQRARRLRQPQCAQTQTGVRQSSTPCSRNVSGRKNRVPIGLGSHRIPGENAPREAEPAFACCPRASSCQPRNRNKCCRAEPLCRVFWRSLDC